MLSATKLSKAFGGVKAVDGASFEIQPAQITALIGPNGAGKTTLFNLVSGTMSPDNGSLKLSGADISRFAAEERARRGISRTFQLSRPFRNLTVRDHLLLAQDQADDCFWRGLRLGRTQSTQDKELRAVLERVGIDISLDALAADLSYGQSKLLGIAMALIHPHHLMLLDEPVAGVNPVIRERIGELLRVLREQGETIFLIEHDMQFVMSLADQVIVMDRGKIIAHGAPQEIKKDEAVLNAYLGEQL